MPTTVANFKALHTEGEYSLMVLANRIVSAAKRVPNASASNFALFDWRFLWDLERSEAIMDTQPGAAMVPFHLYAVSCLGPKHELPRRVDYERLRRFDGKVDNSGRWCLVELVKVPAEDLSDWTVDFLLVQEHMGSIGERQVQPPPTLATVASTGPASAQAGPSRLPATSSNLRKARSAKRGPPGLNYNEVAKVTPQQPPTAPMAPTPGSSRLTGAGKRTRDDAAELTEGVKRPQKKARKVEVVNRSTQYTFDLAGMELLGASPIFEQPFTPARRCTGCEARDEECTVLLQSKGTACRSCPRKDQCSLSIVWDNGNVVTGKLAVVIACYYHKMALQQVEEGVEPSEIEWPAQVPAVAREELRRLLSKNTSTRPMLTIRRGTNAAVTEQGNKGESRTIGGTQRRGKGASSRRKEIMECVEIIQTSSRPQIAQPKKKLQAPPPMIPEAPPPMIPEAPPPMIPEAPPPMIPEDPSLTVPRDPSPEIPLLNSQQDVGTLGRSLPQPLVSFSGRRILPRANISALVHQPLVRPSKVIHDTGSTGVDAVKSLVQATVRQELSGPALRSELHGAMFGSFFSKVIKDILKREVSAIFEEVQDMRQEVMELKEIAQGLDVGDEVNKCAHDVNEHLEKMLQNVHVDLDHATRDVVNLQQPRPQLRWRDIPKPSRRKSWIESDR